MTDFTLPMHSKLAAAVALAFACTAAAASDYYDYPAHPVRLVVGGLPGDTNDLLARVIEKPLEAYFKQPLIIDNHAGASGHLAAARVAQAAHDGYTLLMVSVPFASGVSIYPKLGYDPARDFAAVARLATFDEVLVVNASLRLSTLQDFLSFVRANVGRATIASAGTGTASHLTAELMKLRAGWLSALHVPYRGNGFALAGLLGNHVHALVATAVTAQPHVRTGRLRALAATGARRAAALRDVPTFVELGFPDVQGTAWSGIVAPAGTPYEAIVRLNVALASVTTRNTTRARIQSQGAEVLRETPEQFTSHLRAEIRKWAYVVKAAGIRPE